MAGTARSFLYDLVGQSTLERLPFSGGLFLCLLRCELFLNVHGVAMAFSADLGRAPLHQLLLAGRVRLVAVQAALAIHEGPVNIVLTEGFVHHGVVASPAQLEARLLRLQRRAGRRRLMTLAAHLLSNRLVNVLEEKPCFVAAVRVVA